MDALCGFVWDLSIKCCSTLFCVSSIAILLVFLIESSSFRILLPVCLTELYNYGKCLSQRRKTFDVLRVPKSWFTHFYVVAIVAIFCATPVALHCKETSTGTLVCLLHVTRRLYECLFVHVFSDSKMSIVHYLTGHFFYLSLPVCITCSEPTTDRGLASSAAFLAVIILLETGQHLAMKQLASLRPIGSKGMTTRYLPPTGSLFSHVTCPHFSLELAFYIAVHFYLGLRLVPFSALTVFVLVNQVCSAQKNHRWYVEHFPAYAKHRTSLIPFLL
ncbi:Steroid 5 alpha-reductase 3 [Sparganum proliferum]